MTLRGLTPLLLTDPALAGALDDAREGTVPALDLTAPPALRAFVVAGLVTGADKTVLAVTATGREAEDLVESLGSQDDVETRREVVTGGPTEPLGEGLGVAVVAAR